MTTKELFTVGVRLFGIWVLLRVIENVLAIIDFSMGFSRNANSSIEAAFVHAATDAITGFYLLAGAPHIIRLIYPVTRTIHPPHPSTDTPAA